VIWCLSKKVKKGHNYSDVLTRLLHTVFQTNLGSKCANDEHAYAPAAPWGCAYVFPPVFYFDYVRKNKGFQIDEVRIQGMRPLLISILLAGSSSFITQKRFIPVNMRLAQLKNPFENQLGNIIAEGLETTTDASELPLSFDDAVQRAATCTVEAIRQGNMRIRIDYDTSVGDNTYTSLQQALPMTKLLVNLLSKDMELNPLIRALTKEELAVKAKAEALLAGEAGDTRTDGETTEEPVTRDTGDNSARNEAYDIKEVVQSELEGTSVEMLGLDEQDVRSLRVFFPDMGAAALSRRDWKMNSPRAEVPPCVFSADIGNDALSPQDRIALLLCPLSYEADSVRRVLSLCDDAGIPVVMINPQLVNMDQGYGVRARKLRSELLSTFVTAYKLKTMPQGAIIREWPSGYSLWNEVSELVLLLNPQKRLAPSLKT
jgi:hypothetical protein